MLRTQDKRQFIGRELRELPLRPYRPVKGMSGWWDAAETSSLTIVSNNVSQWDDKSGNGFNMTQATAGNRPTYNSSPRTINGIIIPEFETAAGRFMDSTCPVSSDRSSTWFAVGLADANSAGGRSIIGDVGTGGFDLRFVNTNVIAVVKSGVGGLASFAHGSLLNSQAFIICVRLTATTIQLNAPGFAYPGAAESTTFTASRTVRLGTDSANTSGQRWDGLIAEIIVYDTTLSEADMHKNFLYLVEKWLVP